MAQVRKVITKINRYLFEEEAHYIINTLNDFNYPNKLHRLSKTAYMVELPNIDENDRKKMLKEELNSIGFTIYKTDKTLKDLKIIQAEKELLAQEIN